jgi:hypothetical protein
MFTVAFSLTLYIAKRALVNLASVNPDEVQYNPDCSDNIRNEQPKLGTADHELSIAQNCGKFVLGKHQTEGRKDPALRPVHDAHS